MSTNAIVVDNLVKHYPGGVTAVDGVSFSVGLGSGGRSRTSPRRWG